MGDTCPQTRFKKVVRGHVAPNLAPVAIGYPLASSYHFTVVPSFHARARAVQC